MRKPARATLWSVVCAAIILGYVPQSHSRTVMPAGLPELTQSAARIFRGRCVTAEVGTAEIAGARISITTYVFELSEYLKGVAPARSHVALRTEVTPVKTIFVVGYRNADAQE